MNSIIKSNNEIFDSFGKTAANIIMYFEGEEREDLLKQLRTEVEKLCNIEEKVQIERNICEEIAAFDDPEVDNEEGQNNRVEEYKTRLAQRMPDASKNENLIEFDRIVKELKNANLKDAEDNDGDDGELQLTRNAINLIDPVTKKRMTDPVRNKICGHVYDRESVTGLLGQNIHTRCPVPGCRYKEYLSMDNMKTDIVTKIYLEKNPA